MGGSERVNVRGSHNSCYFLLFFSFFQSGVKSCVFGCKDGKDDLEHYMCCPILNRAFTDISRIHCYNGPLGMLALGFEDDRILLLRVIHLYVVFVTYNKLRHMEAPSDVNVQRLLRAKWNDMCGSS